MISGSFEQFVERFGPGICHAELEASDHGRRPRRNPRRGPDRHGGRSVTGPGCPGHIVRHAAAAGTRRAWRSRRRHPRLRPADQPRPESDGLVPQPAGRGGHGAARTVRPVPAGGDRSSKRPGAAGRPPPARGPGIRAGGDRRVPALGRSGPDGARAPGHLLQGRLRARRLAGPRPGAVPARRPELRPGPLHQHATRQSHVRGPPGRDPARGPAKRHQFQPRPPGLERLRVRPEDAVQRCDLVLRVARVRRRRRRTDLPVQRVVQPLRRVQRPAGVAQPDRQLQGPGGHRPQHGGHLLPARVHPGGLGDGRARGRPVLQRDGRELVEHPANRRGQDRRQHGVLGQRLVGAPGQLRPGRGLQRLRKARGPGHPPGHQFYPRARTGLPTAARRPRTTSRSTTPTAPSSSRPAPWRRA